MSSEVNEKNNRSTRGSFCHIKHHFVVLFVFSIHAVPLGMRCFRTADQGINCILY